MSRVQLSSWRLWAQRSLPVWTLRAGMRQHQHRHHYNPTIIHSGCYHPKEHVLRLLTSMSLFPLRTPLHAAAFAGNVDCVQLLLAHDAPVDAVDQSGLSALMMAAERGRIGAVGNESPSSVKSTTHLHDGLL